MGDRNQITTPARKRRLQVSLLSLALCVTSCKAVFDYPADQRESGMSACSDGTDNDFDGRIDCDDAECDGFCPEEDSVRCEDGRDNDGDGLVDASDPRCWPLDGPETFRCASHPSTDFEEGFDGQLSSARWSVYGDRLSLGLPASRPDRPDGVVRFVADAAGGETVLVSKTLFEGDWGGFALRHRVRVERGGLLRVGLVPAVYAPAGKAPVQGAELSSMAIEVDARDAPSLTLLIDGQRVSAGDLGLGAWHELRLEAEDGDVVLVVDGEVRWARKRPSLGASRLVVWGASTQPDGGANGVQVDDLHLMLPGTQPCGVASPQIPFGAACPLDDSVLDENVGYAVSVAANASQGFCAVLTAGDVGQDTPVRARSWRSETGEAWARGGELPVGVDVVRVPGVGVARDLDEGVWRAAMVVRHSGSTTLRIAESKDCNGWEPGVQVAVLPDDAEAPSYLIPGVTSRHEVYFTRPAEPGSGPTLWRAVSSDGQSFTLQEAAVAILPADGGIHPPVALTRAGRRDVVISHPVSPATGIVGLGLWVAMDEDLSSWAPVAGGSLLATAGSAGGFDSEAILSGTVVWGEGHDFVLYGAEGEPVSSLHRSGSAGSVTAGTARLLPASGVAPPSTDPARRRCGDGACDGGETCDDCPVDCGVCDGDLILSDSLADAGLWRYVGLEGDGPSASHYHDGTSERLHVSAGMPGWLARQLDSPLLGDFELSFDVHWVAPESQDGEATCAAYVGLARSADSSDLDPPGIYARLDRQWACDERKPAFSPSVRLANRRLTSRSVEEAPTQSGFVCSGAVTGIPEAWHHVSLRRRSGEVSMHVTGGDGCGTLGPDATVAYPGPVDGFTDVLVGWGGKRGPQGWVVRCKDGSARMTVDNVVLRALPCPDGGESCTDPVTGQSVCVDVSESPEHCGGCFAPVGAVEACVDAEPVCAETTCTTPGSGLLSCADLTSSPNHCGSCGNVVGALESCGDGYPRAAMVQLPEGFAVDATEVTRAQYEAWLRTGPDVSDQGTVCAWNTSFEPTCFWPPAGDGDKPVVCVDWCDAKAYCGGVGKRLCGAVDGGPVPYGKTNTTAAQWFAACSSGGANTFAYGPAYEPSACNGVGNLPGGAPYNCAVMVPVGTLLSCQSPLPSYGGVFDMSGNVAEWIDSCSQETGEDDACRFAGGSTCAGEEEVKCGTLHAAPRGRTHTEVGFRCCSY